MKKYLNITVIVLFGCALWGCQKDFLNAKKDIKAEVSVSDLFSNYGYNQQAVWKIYSYLPDGFADLDMEAATDNAAATNSNNRSHVFNRGTWNQYNNPNDVYSHYFYGIRRANLYLKKGPTVDITYVKDKITGTDSTSYYNAKNNVKFMRGEVFFLKAFFYFELVKRYGGVPILKEPFDFYNKKGSWNGIPRNSLDDCLKYIVKLCDSASAIIPKDLSPYGWYEKGRVTYGAIKALKARTLLYGASPLYKDNGSTITWAEAAKTAHDVIALGQYSLDPDYAHLFGSDNVNSPGLIFARRYGKINWLEYDNFPIVFQESDGNGITPTENLVDDFEVLKKDNSGNITGARPFDWDNPQDAAQPYVNRDPRFYATVVYSGSTFSGQTIETYRGGNSGLPKPNATKTGYYLKKWIDPSVDIINGTSTDHAWIYFRYGEILLDYAEAMYHAYGADNDPMGYGMTSLQAINKIRARAGMPDIVASRLDEERLEHERNVELSFENQRFWDVRRWEKGETYFNKPAKRIDIEKNGTLLNYTVQKLGNRVFEKKMNWFPIPQDEISKTNWDQNPGW